MLNWVPATKYWTIDSEGNYTFPRTAEWIDMDKGIFHRIIDHQHRVYKLGKEPVWLRIGNYIYGTKDVLVKYENRILYIMTWKQLQDRWPFHTETEKKHWNFDYRVTQEFPIYN